MSGCHSSPRLSCTLSKLSENDLSLCWVHERHSSYSACLNAALQSYRRHWSSLRQPGLRRRSHLSGSNDSAECLMRDWADPWLVRCIFKCRMLLWSSCPSSLKFSARGSEWLSEWFPHWHSFDICLMWIFPIFQPSCKSYHCLSVHKRRL